jgi:hypothetical protein
MNEDQPVKVVKGKLRAFVYRGAQCIISAAAGCCQIYLYHCNQRVANIWAGQTRLSPENRGIIVPFISKGKSQLSTPE